MGRVVMQPAMRRAELVQAARQLFMTKGYEATSIEDIIGMARVSKGAFYHYFTSKSAVLEALADQIAEESAAETSRLLDAPGLNAFERLQMFLRHQRSLKIERASEMLTLFEWLFRPENLELHHRVIARVSGRIIPLIAQIIGQGMEEEVFLPGDPLITAEIVVAMATTTHSVVAGMMSAADDLSFERAAHAFEKRWKAQGIAVDRVLGLPEGSIEFVEPGFARAFFAGWRSRTKAGRDAGQAGLSAAPMLQQPGLT